MINHGDIESGKRGNEDLQSETNFIHHLETNLQGVTNSRVFIKK